MHDWTAILATTAPDPAQQKAVGQAFLLIVVLIIVGILVVIGLLMAGFAWFARANADRPVRKDRYPGVDAWEESARRTDTPGGSTDDDEDWEADED